MNENLNLIEILKDCPSGTKLYSTIFGEVEFDHIENNSKYPIIIKTERCGIDRFSIDGKRFFNCGECILFPSKEQRDWSKFNPKKKNFVPPCKFKDGDIVATKNGSQVFILKRDNSNGKGYCYTGYNFNYDEPFRAGVWCFSRLATEEEKQRLFDAIKEQGYKWNAETKTLEKFVESKFDPKTLKPFDKVLEGVKHDGVMCWRIDLFSHIISKCIYLMGGVGFRVIPYNEETKHLVGTKEEAPEFYRYWED